MNLPARKKSPRAPSIALDDAIEKVNKIYEKERRHPAPADLVAQHLGYKDSKNGAALTMLASLKYYGLLERTKTGVYAVSKEFEAYKFAPNEQLKVAQIQNWLKTPAIFSELLGKYSIGLPSEANLKFDLIQMGFSPDAAVACLQSFLRSVEHAHYFDEQRGETIETIPSVQIDNAPPSAQPSRTAVDNIQATQNRATETVVPRENFTELDRIPVRLSGGRRAWIEIPSPFYSSDKERLKAQIDLLLADDLDE